MTEKTASPIDVIFQYHNQTKHHPHRYARSLGYLDWASQPDPFRRYHGAPWTPLPLAPVDRSSPYDTLYTGAPIEPEPLSVHSLAALLEHSLAISAWKEYQGSRWALRCNPSSGNLHPTEGYVIAGPVDGFSQKAAIYHYAPAEHGLELRQQIDAAAWTRLTAAFPDEVLFVGLSSVHWREAWKYGERAYRYCQHDAGHAIAALALAARSVGWQAIVLDELSEMDVAGLLGLNPADYNPDEIEHADCLLAVLPDLPLRRGPGGYAPHHPLRKGMGGCGAIYDTIVEIARGARIGNPNQLSHDHVLWPIIPAAAEAAIKPRTSPATPVPPPPQSARTHNTQTSAWAIIKQRRSAVAMDGSTTITADTFYTMLARVMPAPPVWSCWRYAPQVHLALFVHRVEGLLPGLYMLMRDEARTEEFRALCRSDFLWTRAQGCPPHLPLFTLAQGDYRRASTTASCHQDIAGDGAFSLGMLAEFSRPIRAHGAWVYPRLFWECGFIGQILYLEAEAAGMRATGIGCFFDDTTHEILDLSGQDYQCLYHFTVGGPIEDTRLTTLPPYDR